MSDNLYTRNGIFYARATVGNVEHRKSLQTRSKREAEKRLKEWLKGLSPYHGTIRKTYMEAVVEWIEANAAHWKPETRKRYNQSLTMLEPYFGKKFWDEVNKDALMQYMKARRHTASVATINRDLTVISGIAKHVSELPGWPEGNPVERLPRRPRKASRWIYVRPNVADIEEIFERMQGTFGDLCRFALVTGMRSGEITNLQRQDALNGGARLYEQKNSGVSVVPFNDEALEIIARQPVVHGSPYLFNTRNGGRYNRASEMFREVVNRAQKMAQSQGRSIRPMRFHDLRHEFAIRYLEKGGGIFTLQKILRHSTIGQTERYLDYLTPDQAEKSKLGSAQ